MVRTLLLGLGLCARTAFAAPPSPDAGFHLEPRAQIDDVFGDSSDYRRVVDRFLVLGDTMQRTRDEFARQVQGILAELRPPPGTNAKPPRRCPEVVGPQYARALVLGQDYLRTGRELTRWYEQIREYDRLGETLGLTPDYRVKVRRVVAQYNALLTDYREMKVAFHDQLSDELRHVGCNLDKLAAAVPPSAREGWPAPGAPGAPGVPTVNGATEKVAVAPPPPAKSEKPAVLMARAETLPAVDAGARVGILFYVDNTRCPTGMRVTLDGKPLGEVPGATRMAFTTTPGPHDLCLVADAAKKCGDPGTLRKSYFHEGWTIALRCD